MLMLPPSKGVFHSFQGYYLITLSKSRDVSDLLREILMAVSLFPSWEGTALHNSVHLLLFSYV